MKAAPRYSVEQRIPENELLQEWKRMFSDRALFTASVQRNSFSILKSEQATIERKLAEAAWGIGVAMINEIVDILSSEGPDATIQGSREKLLAELSRRVVTGFQGSIRPPENVLNGIIWALGKARLVDSQNPCKPASAPFCKSVSMNYARRQRALT